jgi:hypothetical protein
MATGNAIDDSEGDSTVETTAGQTTQREVVIEGVLSHKWSWILGLLSLYVAWWFGGHIGSFQGTGTFYVGMFIVLAALSFLYIFRSIRRGLKELEYANV